MFRFLVVAVLAFVALGFGMFLSSSAHPQGRLALSASAVTGEWTGRYVCGQGVTALRLSVSRASNGGLSATFNFGPLPENPTVPTGAYRMEGSFDPATRKVRLHGVQWIDQHSGYVMVDLDGRMDADGARIGGQVPDWAGCTVFEVRRAAPLVS